MADREQKSMCDAKQHRQAAAEDLASRIREALKNVKPGSELDRVLRRWDDYEFTVKVDGRWLLGGFTNFFRHCLDLMHAVDPSIDPRLPRHCYDPDSVAHFFRIPVHELIATEDRPEPVIVGPVGKPGRKPTMDAVADFAYVRRQKEMPWKEILSEWRKACPYDKRNVTLSRMQEAYYRKYRRKGKTKR